MKKTHKIITLTPYDSELSGKYSSGQRVVVLCDAQESDFSVTLPDGLSVESVDFNFVKIDTSENIVSITTQNNQTISSRTTITLRLPYEGVIILPDRSNFQLIPGDIRGIPLENINADTSVEVANGLLGLTIPSFLHGYKIISAIASVHDKGVTGSTNIQIRRRRAGVNTNLLTTVLSIGDEYYAADGIINDDNAGLEQGDILYRDIQTIHSGTAPNGLNVTLTVRR